MLARIGTVALRDFNAVVRTKGFIIGLLFMPLLMFASVAVPQLLERFGETGDRKFAVADFTGRIAAPMAERVAARSAEPGRKLRVQLEPVDLAARSITAADFPAAKDALAGEFVERVRKQELFGYLIIGPRTLDLPARPDAVAPANGQPSGAPEDAEVVYGARSLTAGELRQILRDSVNDCVRAARLLAAEIDPEIVKRIDQRPPFREFIVSKQPGGEGAVRSSGMQEALVPMGIVILLLMGVMQSAGLLLNSTIEEKSNRVVEVLVSSVSPFQLLAGKIIGAWMTGLIVLVAWGAAAIYTADHYEILRSGVFSPGNVAWLLFFFLFGYLIFAAIYAAVGAMCSSIQDAQSMMLPVIILIMIPMLSLSHVVEHPESTLSQVLAYLPFCAPFIAPLRLSISPPAPQWQTAISAVSLVIGTLFFMWGAGKIFRIAIFMTGKPPRPAEIWRWLRES